MKVNLWPGNLTIQLNKDIGLQTPQHGLPVKKLPQTMVMYNQVHTCSYKVTNNL